ncbi:hypothetical protein [uncultured Draconibacterium sp.]|uniref:hypothetical protein n=1 Tax=uncultured Draconibacterium sp. TaxID=1573823 RepID=UPI0029C884AE|nr:hypothetical protein [uncultured Draconibacterium sp.]
MEYLILWRGNVRATNEMKYSNSGIGKELFLLLLGGVRPENSGWEVVDRACKNTIKASAFVIFLCILQNIESEPKTT